jgi:hypothetical protein
MHGRPALDPAPPRHPARGRPATPGGPGARSFQLNARRGGRRGDQSGTRHTRTVTVAARAAAGAGGRGANRNRVSAGKSQIEAEHGPEHQYTPGFIRVLRYSLHYAPGHPGTAGRSGPAAGLRAGRCGPARPARDDRSQIRNTNSKHTALTPPLRLGPHGIVRLGFISRCLLAPLRPSSPLASPPRPSSVFGLSVPLRLTSRCHRAPRSR